MFRDNSLDGTPYHYKRKDPGIINRPEVARVTVDLSDGQTVTLNGRQFRISATTEVEREVEVWGVHNSPLQSSHETTYTVKMEFEAREVEINQTTPLTNVSQPE